MIVVNEAFVARYYKKEPMVVGRHFASGNDVREIVGVDRERPAGLGGLGESFEPISTIAVPLRSGIADVNGIFDPGAHVVSALMGRPHALPPRPPSRVFVRRHAGRRPASSDRAGEHDRRASRREARVPAIHDAAGGRARPARTRAAAVGLQGLIASSVNERTRELGMRLALGATGRQVLGIVVTPGLLLAGIGVIIGSAGALAGTRLMQSFIWGVKPTDPLTFLGVVVVLLAVALLASVFPAMRVLRLDPAKTLRAE